MADSFNIGFGRLTDNLTERFLKQPETGMGYQILFDPTKSQSEQDDSDLPILSNGEYLIQVENNRSTPILTNFENLSIEFEEFQDVDFQIPHSKTGISVVTNSKYINIPKQQNGEQPPFAYITRTGDEFRRLSAFRNDRRVLTSGELLSGTYGTTINDLTVVPSGIAAVGRYALPNRIAACYIYQIIPPPGTLVHFGTVTPNYGLCGGGVEVYFPDGCPPNSARLLETIPEI